jgi:hypothetical protein
MVNVQRLNAKIREWPGCKIRIAWLRKSSGGMHSQDSYWFSIGFKQMVCTVANCYCAFGAACKTIVLL